MNTFLGFVIVLGILIFVHELGHFLFAKLFRVKVLRFSLGFGPKLVGKQHGETEYLVSALPLGGYVKMLGENPTEEVDSGNEDRAFSLKPVWQRFVIVAAGPLSNLGFAVVLFFLMFAVGGVPEPLPGTRIGSVEKNSPAEIAGLKAGDAIVAIDGKEMKEWREISEYIGKSGGAPIRIRIERDGEAQEVTAQPTSLETKNILGEKMEDRMRIGISMKEEFTRKQVSVAEAFSASIDHTSGIIMMMGIVLKKMIQKSIPASELGGPILIAQMAGQQMKEGLYSLLHYIGLLSVNLGLLNLLPVPILDGGHLVFFSVEAIRRRPLSQKTMEMFQQIGLFILASLMIFVFYNDIVRLFTKS